MSAVPEGANPAGEPARLGEVLIQRGLLTEDQLAAALEEQQQSGRPLGETLIALGFVAAPVIGQALATQHGGLLKTEYGFATGFPPKDAAPGPVQIAPPEPPSTGEAPPPPIPVLRIALPQDAPEPAVAAPVEVAPEPEAGVEVAPEPEAAVEIAPEAEPVEASVPEPAPEPEQPAEPAPVAPLAAVAAVAPELDPRDEELEELRVRVEQVTALEAVLEAARKSVAAVTAERDAAQDDVEKLAETVERLEREAAEAPANSDNLEAEMAGRAELNERLSSLQQRLDEAFEQLTALRSVREELAEATKARDEAVARLTEAEVKLGELRAELAAAPVAAPAADEADEPRFLALVPTAQGYRLLELDGKEPAVGSRVELPEELGGNVREVLSVGGSPLPASALRCVHLI